MDITGYEYVQHRIILRPWGAECQFTVSYTDTAKHLNQVIPVAADISENDLAAKIKTRCDQIKALRDFIASLRTEFSGLGDETKTAAWWLIRKIRQYPNATLAQAEAAWNAEWAESLFTWNKIVAFVQARAGGVTWDQFKTFVINNKFRELDD